MSKRGWRKAVDLAEERLGSRAPRIYFDIDAIPRNPMGKVLRHRLVELAQARLQQASGKK